MNNIFWGLLLLLFDIKINEISLLPDFVGYLLIYFGMKEHNLKHGTIDAYAKAQPWAIAGTVFSAIFWLPLFDAGYIPTIVGIALHLVVTWFIARGVQQMEQQSEREISASRLNNAWFAMLVFHIFTPLARLEEALAILIVAAGFVASLVYIVIFYRCKKALEN